MTLVDHFSGGQHCEETNAGRSTKVDFRCCSDGEKDSRSPNTHKKNKKTRKAKANTLASFASIREPSVCTYEVVVCTPLLCGGKSQNVSAFSLLESLNGVCLSRHEGWWSYEFCYKKQMRQFHLVTVTDAKGKVASQVQDEYLLGKADVEAEFKGGESRYITHPGINDEPAALELEYQDGTVCELTKQQRASTVQFLCGSTDTIVSVVEDHTCHYKVVITTPTLCKHPAFVRESPATRSMACRPQDER
mmetsp:Transcript_38178/g.88055  ORF Transcript_38178/g.88055 Transcript_38178/m.88055 type:complete len:248 (+) Transcript_38178:3-746(+)